MEYTESVIAVAESADDAIKLGVTDTGVIPDGLKYVIVHAE
jgi:hypothetical protein